MCPFISAINPKARSSYMIAVCVLLCVQSRILPYMHALMLLVSSFHDEKEGKQEYRKDYTGSMRRPPANHS